MSISIIDYGRGNLRSVQKGLEQAGTAEVVISSDPAVLSTADGLVLPGVGAFRDAMQRLHDTGLDELIRAATSSGTPLLGICLGMQLLLEVSYEFGVFEGLGLIPGEVRGFDTARHSLKVPHIGWNTVDFSSRDPLFADIVNESYFYFVHSYVCVPHDDANVVGRTSYGAPFCSALRYGNIVGTQFHPEKSSTTGLRLLQNFVMLCTTHNSSSAQLVMPGLTRHPEPRRSMKGET
ncbi:MAG: imidazole glycerol phosphate synthase subunit HisH [Actinomycetes bacterium]|nr:imidazole glycerol phosphate synthase subunit HisH [Actinomycetes bacterium]